MPSGWLSVNLKNLIATRRQHSGLSPHLFAGRFPYSKQGHRLFHCLALPLVHELKASQEMEGQIVSQVLGTSCVPLKYYRFSYRLLVFLSTEVCSEWKVSGPRLCSWRLCSGCIFPCMSFHCQFSVCQDQGHGWQLERLSVAGTHVPAPTCVYFWAVCALWGSAAMGAGFSCRGFYRPSHVRWLQQQWWYERLEWKHTAWPNFSTFPQQWG